MFVKNMKNAKMFKRILQLISFESIVYILLEVYVLFSIHYLDVHDKHLALFSEYDIHSSFLQLVLSTVRFGK